MTDTNQQPVPMNLSATAEDIHNEWDRVVPIVASKLRMRKLYKAVYINSAKQTYVYAVGGMLVDQTMSIYILVITPEMTKESGKYAEFERRVHYPVFTGNVSDVEDMIHEATVNLLNTFIPKDVNGLH